MSKPFFNLRPLCTLTLLTALSLLSGCDKSIQNRLAEQEAAQKTLAISPTLFATRFNRDLSDVLADEQGQDAARMAPLYAIDVTRMVSDDQQYIFKTEVGPARTSILGKIAKSGDLSSVGALLTQRSDAARDEFYLCAETISRVLTSSAKSGTTSGTNSGANSKLPDMIRRLAGNALNNPGQRMSEVIGDKILSAEIVTSGLLFTVEQQQ